MKILLLGDASNYHNCLAQGLSRLGHDVVVASSGSGWMNTGRTIDLSRRGGKPGGALLWFKLNTLLASRLKGYDVVQIHNPIFVNLRPKRVRALFDRLRRDNGSVFLTALGVDTPYVEMCLDGSMPLRYNEWMVSGTPSPYYRHFPETARDWLKDPLLSHCRYIYDNIDGVVTALYEYHLACQRVLPAEKLAYAGIPIDTRSVEFRQIEKVRKVRFMLGRHRGRALGKGSDVLYEMVSRVVAENPDKSEIDIVENIPYADFVGCLGRYHVVVDQLYSYTPATTALLAMASGRATVSGGEMEYYDFIGEPVLRPCINPDPCDLDKTYREISRIVKDPDCLYELSSMGRAFVCKHNDTEVVAARFVDFWERRMR